MQGEGPVKTTEDVMNRAFDLAEQMREDDEAVAEVIAAALGRRVSLVMAQQKIQDNLLGEPAGGLTRRAITLLDRAVESVSD
jgi:hypothetical protein